MILDVAHASESVIDDIISISSAPVVNSHTGVRGVCNNTRNLSDRHIQGIADTGGVLGIAFFRPSQCGDNILDSVVSLIILIILKQYEKNNKKNLYFFLFCRLKVFCMLKT